jgi:hypothetical protein
MARRRRRARWLRDIRKKHVRSAGAHDRWNPSRYKCADCGVQYVRLYRSYGGFFCESDVYCNAHVPHEHRGWYVPLIEDSRGEIWGYTSCPEADIDRWFALTDASTTAPTWRRSPSEWVSQETAAVSVDADGCDYFWKKQDEGDQ